MALLTFRQYAAHRGVSPEAVSKAVKAGRITVKVDRAGKRWIDPARADKEWTTNSDPAKQAGGKAQQRRPTKAGPALDGASNAEPVDPDRPRPPLYSDSRAIREAYQARLAKLEWETRSGMMVPKDQVKIQAFRCARAARDALLGIPERLAAELAGVTDPNVIHAKLTAELTRALEALADAI